jgi:pro-kumamolisin-like protein
MRAVSASSQTHLLAASLVLFAAMCCALSVAQDAGPSQPAYTTEVQRPLIMQPVNEAQRTVLKGNTHPLARPEFDLGSAPATLPMQRMLLVLKRSPQQEFALKKLLDDQQDKHSPRYHKWLTPEVFGQSFGPTDADIQTITAWLQSHGFEVRPTKGRTVIEFSGSASQVKETFHTAIHKYIVRGEQHWANASDPQIPTALAPAVSGIDSLHNFGRKPMSHFFGVVSREKATGKITIPQPEFTFPVSAQNPCNAFDTNCYVVGPYDFAAIYNVAPLWNMSTPIDGTGQSIAIVQNSNINIADAHAFRSIFGLPTNDPNIVVDGADPGVLSPGQFGSESEADLDVEWSGAVAKGATIDLVVSADTDTTAGIDLSAKYIIENNLDGIMSESFGLCEAFLGAGGNLFYNSLWEQAAAQGISIFVSSGDQGSAGCDFFQGTAPQAAANGLAVSGIASTPFNVAVGGTDFNDLTNPELYWHLTNDAHQASALGYIPETTWNDTCTNALFAQSTGGSTNPETNCNNTNFVNFVTTGGGSGGVSSVYNTKPSWQTGFGLAGARDLPDVSLFASDGFVGNFYVFCQGDITATGGCDLNAPFADFGGVGGTSVSAPAMAGIMALVNQQMAGSRQGNPNYVLYQLAKVPGVFNDVTTGTIRVPCVAGSPDCTTTNSADRYGIISGYDAGPGYDLATGLGSVNANNLVMNWSMVTSTLTATTTTLVLNGGTSVNVVHGTAVPVQINVTHTSGTGTASGDVSLINADTGQGIDGFSLVSGSVTGQSTSLLLGGSNYHVKAHYAGDGIFSASDSNIVVVNAVTAESSTTSVTTLTFDQSGHAIPFTGGPFGSFVYVRADVSGLSGQGSPTGTVTFTDTFGVLPGGGTFALNSTGNAANPNGITFDAGPHSIKATYAPGADLSFQASASSAQNFTITPGFFVASGPVGVTIASPGASGTTTIGILASTSFPTVTFACSGLPAEAACSPASVTGGGPTTIATATITVTTTGPHLTQRFDQGPYYLARWLTTSGFALAGVFLIGSPRKRRRAIRLLLISAVLAFVVMLPACGGNSSKHQQDPGTPLGTYPIIVNATGGGVSQSVQFTLTVN